MSEARSFVAVVPVRGGSKGLPGKNLRPLNGVPLYLYAVMQAVRAVGRCLISTDIEDILSAELPPGCEAVRRPPELARDDTPMAPVISHLIEHCGLQAATIVLLQATSPLRLDGDIEAALKLHAEGRFDLVMSVTRKDSGILKYGTVQDGRYIPLRDPQYCFSNRQELPPVYCSNGAVYVFDARAFMREARFPSDSMGALEMPADRSLDIDSLEDFERVAAILNGRART